MPAPIIKSLQNLAEPFAPEVKSTLEELVEKLPSDFTMKESAIPEHLKRVSNPLTGKGLKNDELEFSGILDSTSTKKLSKKDLQLRIGNRSDKFSSTTLRGGQTEFDDTVLKEFKSPTYKEHIRRYVNKGNGQISNKRFSHFTKMGIQDELYFTRKAVTTLNNDDISQKGNIIFEFQSDSHQIGRQFGYTIDDADNITNKLRTEKDKKNDTLSKLYDDWELVSIENQKKFLDKEQRKTLSNKLVTEFRQLHTNISSIKIEIGFIETKLDRIKNKEFSSLNFPGKLPFTDDWLNKAIESELVEASSENLKFIAVPLEVGSDDLVRSPGVQKWYETQVRGTLKKKVETLNKDIKKKNSDAGPDQLFSYEEVKIINSGSDLREIRPDFEELDTEEFIGSLTFEDRNFFVSSNAIPGRIDNLTDKLVADGIYTNTFHAREAATLTIAIELFNGLTAAQSNKLIISTFGEGKFLTERTSHTIGKINLPINEAPLPQSSRANTSFLPSLDRDSVINYVNNASIEELKIIIDNSIDNLGLRKDYFTALHAGEIDFTKIKKLQPGEPSDLNFSRAREKNAITPEALQKKKETMIDKIMELPPIEIERLSRIASIRRLNSVPETSKLLPGWFDSIRLYQAALVTPIIAGVQKRAEAGVDQEAIKAKLLTKEDLKFRAEISKALQAGAPIKDISDHLVNVRGKDRDEVDAIIENVMQSNVKSLLDQDVPVEDIFKALLDRGFDPKTIDNYLPPNNLLESVYDFYVSNFEITESMIKSGIELITGLPLTEEDDNTSKIAARVDASYSTVAILLKDFGIPLTRTMAIQAKEQSIALQAANIKELRDKGIPFELNKRGDIIIQNARGNFVELTSSFYDLAITRKDELLGSVAGGFTGAKLGAKAGAKIPGPPVAKAVGAVGGALVGTVGGGSLLAGIGRGSDIFRNRLYNREEIEGKFIRDEMVAAGTADGILTLMGAGVIKTGGLSWKLAKWSYDKTINGNLNGAHRALMEYLHMTPEKADELVQSWVKLNPSVALSKNRKKRHFEVLSRVDPLAYRLGQPAMQLNSKASINMSREINKRQLDLINSLSESSNERIGAIINDALPKYEDQVQNIYNGTKELAIQTMRRPSVHSSPNNPIATYAFDYDKLVIEPSLRDAVDGIDHPDIRNRANNLFMRIKAIGGKEITTDKNEVQILVLQNKAEGFRKLMAEFKDPKIKVMLKEVESEIKALEKTEIVTTNTRRTFSELLELRELVKELKSKPNIKATKDIAMFDTMLNKVDKEITKAVRGHMDKDTSKSWLEAWSKAKQGMDNLFDVRSNVLFKAITKTGTSDPIVMKALVERAQALDGTYREIMQALPIKLRAPVESGLIRELIEQSTIGDKSGLAAIDFVTLDKRLKHIPMSTDSNKKYKQAINEMARVYKNDPHLLAASGNVRRETFTSYLTDDPIIRIKYATISFFFNYIKRLLPTEGGRRSAMLIKLGQVMQKPHDSTLVNQLVDMLPPDPAQRNELKRMAAEIADFNEKSTFPKVEVYGTTKEGHTSTPVKGSLGLGRYVYTNKTKARTASKTVKGSKLNTELLLEDRIADEIIIKQVLNLSKDEQVTPSLIRGSKKLKGLLEDRGYNGIIFKDIIMLF